MNSSLPAVPETTDAPIITLVRPATVSTCLEKEKLPDTLMRPAIVNETEPPRDMNGLAAPPLATRIGTVTEPTVTTRSTTAPIVL